MKKKYAKCWPVDNPAYAQNIIGIMNGQKATKKTPHMMRKVLHCLPRGLRT